MIKNINIVDYLKCLKPVEEKCVVDKKTWKKLRDAIDLQQIDIKVKSVEELVFAVMELINKRYFCIAVDLIQCEENEHFLNNIKESTLKPYDKQKLKLKQNFGDMNAVILYKVLYKEIEIIKLKEH